MRIIFISYCVIATTLLLYVACIGSVAHYYNIILNNNLEICKNENVFYGGSNDK